MIELLFVFHVSLLCFSDHPIDRPILYFYRTYMRAAVSRNSELDRRCMHAVRGHGTSRQQKPERNSEYRRVSSKVRYKRTTTSRMQNPDFKRLICAYKYKF